MCSKLTQRVRLLLKRTGQLPSLRYPINRFWNTYEHVKFVYNIRQNLRSKNLRAHIDPYRVFWIRTEQIKIMSFSSFDFIVDTGKIVSGPWDRGAKDVEDGSHYGTFKRVFERGHQWKETKYYINLSQKIREDRNKRYANIAELEEKLAYYEHVFEDFKQGDYKLQSELVTDNENSSFGDGGRALFPSLTDRTLMRHEIAVNIGRDGTLLRNDGRHRLALALLAGLDEVPVRIVVRHTKWQQLRDKVAQTIDDGLDDGMPAEQIHDHVEQTLADELEPVALGLEHPDLAIIFERRLSDYKPT